MFYEPTYHALREETVVCSAYQIASLAIYLVTGWKSLQWKKFLYDVR